MTAVPPRSDEGIGDGRDGRGESRGEVRPLEATHEREAAHAAAARLAMTAARAEAEASDTAGEREALDRYARVAEQRARAASDMARQLADARARAVVEREAAEARATAEREAVTGLATEAEAAAAARRHAESAREVALELATDRRTAEQRAREQHDAAAARLSAAERALAECQQTLDASAAARERAAAAEREHAEGAAQARAEAERLLAVSGDEAAARERERSQAAAEARDAAEQLVAAERTAVEHEHEAENRRRVLEERAADGRAAPDELRASADVLAARAAAAAAERRRAEERVLDAQQALQDAAALREQAERERWDAEERAAAFRATALELERTEGAATQERRDAEARATEEDRVAEEIRLAEEQAATAAEAAVHRLALEERAGAEARSAASALAAIADQAAALARRTAEHRATIEARLGPSSGARPSAPEGPVPPDAAGEAPAAAAGAGRLSRYRLDGAIERGRSRAVWSAWDHEAGTPVLATVVFAPSAEHARDWLDREGRLVGSLDHPSIVPVLDVFVEGRAVYVITPVADASPIAHGPASRLPAASVRALLAPVAEALAEAHERGVPHLLLSPAAVLVDAAGLVRVTGFGLAPLQRRAAGDGAEPAFAAPEQLLRHAAGAPADLYALGVLAFLLLTGALPFPAPPADRATHARDRKQALRSLRTSLHGGDDPLCDLVEALLAWAPEARPTAAEAAAELRRSPVTPDRAGTGDGDGAPAVGATTGPDASGRLPWQDLRGFVRAAILAGLLLAAIGVSMLAFDDAPEGPSAASEERAAAPGTASSPAATAAETVAATSKPAGGTAARTAAAVAALPLEPVPSRTCRFHAPAGWQVVWADLERGGVVHNEVRGPQPQARVVCQVVAAPAPDPEAAASAARAEGRGLEGYGERTFAREPDAPAGRWRWEYTYESAGVPVAVTRLFTAGGAELWLEAPVEQREALQTTYAGIAERFRGRPT